MNPSRSIVVFLVMAFFASLAMLLFSGCQSPGNRDAEELRQMIVPPNNPDIPAIEAQINEAASSASRASLAARRADAIASQIATTSAAQEEQIKALRLELTTTIEDLRLTEQSLETSLAQAAKLKVDVQNLTDWGIKWQQEAHRAQEQVSVQRQLAEAHRQSAMQAGRERDVFVVLFSILLAVFVTTQASPYLNRLQPPWLAMAAYVGTPVIAFLAAYLGIRLVLNRIVALTIF